MFIFKDELCIVCPEIHFFLKNSSMLLLPKMGNLIVSSFRGYNLNAILHFIVTIVQVLLWL